VAEEKRDGTPAEGSQEAPAEAVPEETVAGAGDGRPEAAAPEAGPERPAPEPGPSAAGRAALALGAFALVLGLGLAGAGGWFGRQLQQELRRQAEAGADLARRLETVTARQAEIARRLEQAVADAVRERQALQEAFEALARDARRRAGGWRIAEAEYLVRMAARRLRLAGDVDAALAAVAEADAVVRELADPGLIPVREALARARAALEAVPRPDVEGMALELASLGERVEALPLAPAYRRPAPPAGPGAAAEAGQAAEGPAWRRALATAWEALRGLVVVRRADRPIQPLLAPDEQYFLVLNLRLKLDAARVALLERRERTFRAALADARAWLLTYFDPEDAAVKAMAASLARLGEARLRPELPNLAEPLAQLREALAARPQAGRTP